ncbi:MAG: hypothetical protein ABJO67_06015 [Pseudoruegeria sp.]
MSLRSACILICLMSTAAAAQEALTRIDQKIELRAHERLQALRRQEDAILSEFTTDGCSGWQSQIWSFVAEKIPSFAEAHQNLPPWENCCVIHDQAYHTGGDDPDATASFYARLTADETLKACVIDTATQRSAELSDIYGMTEAQVATAYQTIGDAMYAAVRVGGAPCSGLSWRWGYGYPDCK